VIILLKKREKEAKYMKQINSYLSYKYVTKGKKKKNKRNINIYFTSESYISRVLRKEMESN